MGWQFDKFHAAPVGAKKIVAFDENDNRRSIVGLGGLKPPDRSMRMYSFGLLSDTHLGINDDAYAAFSKAVDYMDADDDVELIFITGDITNSLAVEQFDLFKGKFNYVDGKPVTKKGGKGVFAVSGNHEVMDYDKKLERVVDATGIGIWSYIEHGGDVFLLLGCHSVTEAIPASGIPACQLFVKEDLVAICDYVAAKKQDGKRIFAMKHYPLTEEHADFDPSTKSRFYLPMRVYENTTVFYGHQHKYLSMSNLCRDDISQHLGIGYHGVFVPTLCGKIGNEYKEPGQGYIVDVYPNGIHLRGMNFFGEEVQAIPSGTFWIDTNKVFDY